MAYTDINGVFKRYRPINSLIGFEQSQVSSVDVSSIFIADADALIDAYLSRRYSVPLAANPMINRISADLAIFNMLVEKLPETPDFFQPRYDRAIKDLEMLRDGDMALPGVLQVTSGDQEAFSSTQDYHPIFSPVLDPIDQAVDKDQVDADKSDRTGDL
jgi:phage gp36-like protein